MNVEVYVTTADGSLRNLATHPYGRSMEEIVGEDAARLEALAEKIKPFGEDCPPNHPDMIAYQNAVRPYFEIAFAEDRAAQFEADDPYYIDYLEYKNADR